MATIASPSCLATAAAIGYRLRRLGGYRLRRPGNAGGVPRIQSTPRDRSLRILHVIGDLAPESGGPAKAGFEMARAVARRGHDVAIYATDFGQPPEMPRERMRDGVQIRLFPLQHPKIWLASWALRRAL